MTATTADTLATHHLTPADLADMTAYERFGKVLNALDPDDISGVAAETVRGYTGALGSGAIDRIREDRASFDRWHDALQTFHSEVAPEGLGSRYAAVEQERYNAARARFNANVVAWLLDGGPKVAS